jgi:cell division protein FtsI/penicillin-binding protein 2
MPLQPDLQQMQLVGDHYEAPLPDGRRAILTLDPVLQQRAEALLQQGEAPRAAIVMMRLNGDIVALAGQRLEPNGDEPEQLADPNNAVLDAKVATDTWAPAASVFKVVTATALVANGVRADDKVCYHGGLRSVVESNLTDAAGDSSCESLTFGISHSQNAIMAKLAYQHLQPPQLTKTAAAFGFGAPSAVELPGLVGQVSLSEQRDLTFGQNAAGFVGSRLSALGGVQVANTIATAGLRVTPHVIRAIIEADGSVTTLAPRPSTRVLPVATASTVGTMMRQTCESGSAAKSFRRKSGFPAALTAAGKTGTLNGNDPFPMQFSWFVGFAPADAPEYSISVIFGNTESWRLKGHMAASEMIQRALRKP